MAFAGGALAWNLGHNDFATDENASQYMAVHVTLTGIRGLIAPFVGTSLYVWFETFGAGSGAWVFAIAGVLLVIGSIGFAVMARGHREGAE